MLERFLFRAISTRCHRKIPSKPAGSLDEVLPHEPQLRGLAAPGRLPGAHADIDDLVQESFSRLLRASRVGPAGVPEGLPSSMSRPATSPSTTCATSASSGCRGWRKSTRRVSWMTARGVPEKIAHAEEFQHLTQAIQSLPGTLPPDHGASPCGRFTACPSARSPRASGISEHTVEAQGTIGLRKCVEYFRRSGYLPSSRHA